MLAQLKTALITCVTSHPELLPKADFPDAKRAEDIYQMLYRFYDMSELEVSTTRPDGETPQLIQFSKQQIMTLAEEDFKKYFGEALTSQPPAEVNRYCQKISQILPILHEQGIYTYLPKYKYSF